MSLGEGLGSRASLDVTFSDFKWDDTHPGFDKYTSQRDYNPYEQGTFWGKFRARQPFIRGIPMRIIRGELGQTLEEMETRHFIVESFNGPTRDGFYRINAKDALKMADGDRAKCPVASRGFIVGDVSASGTSATLGPSGIGDLLYPTSGTMNIGNKEIVRFTRSGDSLTLTRGQEGTTATDLKAQDLAQICAVWSGVDPAIIIRDLLVDYAGVPSDYIPLEDWQLETGSYLRRLYSAVIAKPEDVNKLLSQLIQEAGLSLWWDDMAMLLRLRVLRKIEADANVYSPENTLHGTLRIEEQQDKRVSQVWNYFGLRTPLLSPTEATNYHSIDVVADADSEFDYGTPAIRENYCRWIPQFGRSIANRLGNIQLGRFVIPPRKIMFSTHRGVDNPELGGGYQVITNTMQNADGTRQSIPAQVTSLRPRDDGFDVTLEELEYIDFDEEDVDNRTITIDSNTFNFNWRTEYDRLFPPPTVDDDIVCIVAATVGSQSTGSPAFNVGSWPSGITPRLIMTNTGRIQGRGGNGGAGRNYQASGSGRGQNGVDGGTAFYSRHNIIMQISSGSRIWGGGGGGGGGPAMAGLSGGGGGGGAGILGGNGGSAQGRGANSGQAGTAASGGAYGTSDRSAHRGGRGGGPGLPGSRSGTGIQNENASSAGGAAGRSIDGDSYVTITGSGDIRGPRVN